jgi:hypothetical protein
MMATNIQPKHVAAFTSMIKIVYKMKLFIKVYIYLLEINLKFFLAVIYSNT